jgi:hypothetical protein
MARVKKDQEDMPVSVSQITKVEEHYPFEIDPNDCEKYGLAPEYKGAKSITVESPVNFSVRW